MATEAMATEAKPLHTNTQVTAASFIMLAKKLGADTVLTLFSCHTLGW